MYVSACYRMYEKLALTNRWGWEGFEEMGKCALLFDSLLQLQKVCK